jgi:hypothetical protein
MPFPNLKFFGYLFTLQALSLGMAPSTRAALSSVPNLDVDINIHETLPDQHFDHESNIASVHEDDISVHSDNISVHSDNNSVRQQDSQDVPALSGHGSNHDQRIESTPPAISINPSILEALLARLTDATVNRPPTSTDPIERPAKGPDARSPDKFDGSDRNKLRQFLAQCRVVFLNHERRFASERARILYAASYLTGVAADWFEPFTLDLNNPVINSWATFESRLQSLFGDPDEVATAEYKLEVLRMREGDHVSNYITKFRTYAAVLDWEDSALRFAFRRGLPGRILDLIALRETKPRSLLELMDVALNVDQRHWERDREKKLYSSRSGASTSVSTTSTFTRSKSVTPSNRSHTPGATSNQPSGGSSSRHNTPRPSSNPLDKVLDQSGKVRADEKKRRFDLGLCLYCGDRGHKLQDCPKRPSDAQGRSVRTAQAPQGASGNE